MSGLKEEFIIMSLTCFAVSDGKYEFTKAALPTTIGHEKEINERTQTKKINASAFESLELKLQHSP